MKKLFDFRIPKVIKETKSETSKNDKGETVTVEKEVEVHKSQKVFLRKPNRSLYDEAELFYGVRLSEGIKAGLLTRALLAKRFSNDGGVLSEDEKNRYADLYLKLYENQLEVDRLSSLGKKRNKKQEEKLSGLISQVAVMRRELTDFEMSQSSLFEQTAENRARNKTILWWTLHISYFVDDEGNESPVFKGDDYDAKLKVYDEIEESEDEFDEELLSKLLYYISFWYVGKVNSEEDFRKLLAETEGEAEEAPEKEAPKEDIPKGETLKEEAAPKEVKKESKAKKKEIPKEEVKST